MARVFSLPTVLRLVPKPLLGRFVEKQEIPMPGIDWPALGERNSSSILEALRSLTNAQMVPIESELCTVYELACDAGINALVETAGAFGDYKLVARMPEGHTAYGQVMWVWLEHPEVLCACQPRVSGSSNWRGGASATASPGSGPTRLPRDSIISSGRSRICW